MSDLEYIKYKIAGYRLSNEFPENDWEIRAKEELNSWAKSGRFERPSCDRYKKTQCVHCGDTATMGCM